MELNQALEFAATHHEGVLATIGRDGRPQLTNILYIYGDPIRISVTETRVKTKNLRRDPRASVHIGGGNFWEWVVLEGTTELSDVAAAPDDAVVDELVGMYRQARGEHDDWDDYRRTMVADRRLVVRFRAERAYGILGR